MTKKKSIPKTRAYIAKNPRFELTSGRHANLHDGQMTIIYGCLETMGRIGSLEDLVRACKKKDYERTFRNPNTDIHESILYQMNRLYQGTHQVPEDTVKPLTLF